MFKAVHKYTGPNNDHKEGRTGVIRDILSHLLDVTSKKDRGIDIDCEAMSLAKSLGHVTVN